MIFTSTIAADILFYSLCEWTLYAGEPHIEEMGGVQKWASTYPLFHWGPIAWGFYIVLAVAFGFMPHVRDREKQKFSEACRPLLGKRIDGLCGKVIELIAIFALLLYVFIAGGEGVYILETGLSALGNMTQNFIGMSTWMDPLRDNSFPQNWTIYYWAYWMVWCVATPFFIGKISKGRTIKNVILGGYGWGLAGTYTAFIILGNYGLAKQMKDGLDVSGYIAEGGAFSQFPL